MKKVIRLTESDLTRIVKRVIKEGGFQGIKNDLEYEEGLHNITKYLLKKIIKFRDTINKLKSILKGSSYDFKKTEFFMDFVENTNDFYLKIEMFKKLISIFKERDMKLTKRDINDYGFDLSEMLNDLEDRYNEIDEFKNLTDDEEILSLLDKYENEANILVDLLYEIPD